MRQEEFVSEAEDASREPELVPVSASVFDDDFFRSSYGRARGENEPTAVLRADSGAESLRSFAAAPSADAGHAETDELDIPAFLRRGHSA
jgi:cell division protein FtsZ